MTRAGVDRLVGLVLAFGLVSLAPIVAADLVTDRGRASPTWTGLVCGAYLVLFVLLVVQAVRRAACCTPALALVVVGNLALATYPFFTTGPSDTTGGTSNVPWVLSLSSLTVAAGAAATSSLTAALLLAEAHLALRLVLQLNGVWTTPADDALLEALGLLVVTTVGSVAVQALQQPAAQVGAARVLAERAATEAATVEATQHENSRWDGIVHDDVLAALSMTAHARDDADRTRARAAAARALASIDSDPDVDAVPVDLAAVGLRLLEAVLDLHPAGDARLLPSPVGWMVAGVADALVAATSEAVRNAVRHGRSPDGTPPAVRVRLVQHTDRNRLTVEIRDDGGGFDTREATARLGLDISVRRRADVVGGNALVRSVPGAGTVVLLGVPLLPVTDPAEPGRAPDDEPAGAP